MFDQAAGRVGEISTLLKMEVQIISWTGRDFFIFFEGQRSEVPITVSLGWGPEKREAGSPPAPVKWAPSVLGPPLPLLNNTGQCVTQQPHFHSLEWPDENNLNRMQRSMQDLLLYVNRVITGIGDKAN